MEFNTFDTVELDSEDSRIKSRGFLIEYEYYSKFEAAIYENGWVNSAKIYNSEGFYRKNSTKIVTCKMVLFEKCLLQYV